MHTQAETISANEDQKQARVVIISDNILQSEFDSNAEQRAASDSNSTSQPNKEESATTAEGQNQVGTPGAESKSRPPTRSESNY